MENRVYRTMLEVFFLIRNESAEDLLGYGAVRGADGNSEFPAEIGAQSLPSWLT